MKSVSVKIPDEQITVEGSLLELKASNEIDAGLEEIEEEHNSDKEVDDNDMAEDW
jgi:hypothetical protein